MLASALLDSTKYEQNGRLDAAKVITNLAASDNSSKKEDEDPDDLIYGGTAKMKDWCCILLKSNALSALVKVLSTSNISDITLCEQCCWALANIAGDSYRCRTALLELPENAMSILLNVLQIGIAHQFAGLCRNATWACNNLLRETAVQFLPNLLHPPIIVHLMLAPKLVSSSTDNLQQWNEVAVEASWMLFFLTSNEDAVQYLCDYQNNDDNSYPSIVQALDSCLRVENNKSSAATIPCIRAVSNIAAAFQGRYVPNLIANSSILQSLTAFIEIGATGTFTDKTIAIEATWSAGSILLEINDDSYKILIPSLCHALVSNTSALALKREAISSLVHAVSLPEVAEGEINKPIRNAMLISILNVNNIIPIIIHLLSSTDMEVVIMALRFVNISFRRLNLLREGPYWQIRQVFEECSILDALESICDRVPISSPSFAVAEMAADLIDDFFSEEVLPRDEDSLISDVFQLGANASQPFIWNTVTANETNNKLDSNISTSLASVGERVRGRGRGTSNIPAWMQQQQQDK